MSLTAQNIPVLLLGFNRPDKARRILEPLRQVRPTTVFVAVDGPRAGHALDEAGCRETQQVFDAEIDWPCVVQKLYRTENQGCRRAVSGAITWAFTHVDELIIIEDDCVLDPSFFSLSAELLPRHQSDEQVCSIAAVNFQAGQSRGAGDYYASKYQHCWGWATWKRAWERYEDDLASLANWVHSESFSKLNTDENERAYWQHAFERCVNGEVDSWAYRWLFSCWRAGGVSLIPNSTLVTNIGFDADATHTSEAPPGLEPVEALRQFEPPLSLVADTQADTFTFNEVYCPPLSHARAEVCKYRIRQLKAEVKQGQEQLKAARAEVAALRRRSWWQMWGSK